MRLFVDTGALAALAHRRDRHHLQAAAFLRALGPADRLQTSNLVFAETTTLLAARHGQAAALRFAEAFLASRRFEVVHYADETLDRAAVAVLRAFRDKALSFTDAATLALVKSHGLDGVFGFDLDFPRCGVRLFPQGQA